MAGPFMCNRHINIQKLPEALIIRTRFYLYCVHHGRITAPYPVAFAVNIWIRIIY